jgi:D-methionine transport system substrate-binding protein
MTSRLRSLVLLPVVLATAMLAAACAAPTGSDSGAATVSIGVADGGEAYWQVFQRKAKAAGIDVQLVNFTDYNQPNPALAQKQLQLNEFQHLQYLANYTKTGTHLV